MLEYLLPTWQYIADLWSTSSDEVKAAVVGVGGTILLAVVTVWQIGKQAKYAIQQNRHNEADKLKLQIYERALEAFRSFWKAEIEYTTFLRTIHTDLSIYKISSFPGQQAKPISARASELNALNHKLLSRTMDLIRLVEEWHVIDPRLYLFQEALNASNFDITWAHNQLFDLALRLFPVPLIGSADPNEALPWSLPTTHDERHLHRLVDDLVDKIDTSGNYVFDFQNELQQLLLGDLFNNRVRVRKPLDSRKFRICLDDYDKLMRYFKTESEWGKHLAEMHIITTSRLRDTHSKE